jgi:hypothetical protein
VVNTLRYLNKQASKLTKNERGELLRDLATVDHFEE